MVEKYAGAEALHKAEALAAGAGEHQCAAQKALQVPQGNLFSASLRLHPFSQYKYSTVFSIVSGSVVVWFVLSSLAVKIPSHTPPYPLMFLVWPTCHLVYKASTLFQVTRHFIPSTVLWITKWYLFLCPLLHCIPTGIRHYSP